MFKQRLLSGIVLVIAVILTLYFGGNVTLLVIAAVSLMGMYELMKVIKKEKSAPAVVAYSGAILYYFLLWLNLEKFILPLALLVLILLFFVYVFTFPRYHINDITMAFFSLFYVTVMLSCIYRIRILENGGFMVGLVFLSAWGNDTLAYCAGRLFGKHKMSPVLSPKKTVEGAIGGVVGAGLLGALYGLLGQHIIGAEPGLIRIFAIICATGGLISIVGDLGASAIKRNFEIKDYSNLIPGHGGILDRFDSIIFTAPIIYYLLVLAAGMK